MFQLWKITHLVGGLYSIRPLHKLSMGLSITDGNVGICEIGSTDAISQVPASARWLIESTANGYVFRQNATMMAATSATGTGVDICVGTCSANSAQCHFELSPVEDTQGALFLFSTSSNTYTSSLSSGTPTVTLGLGPARSLERLGFVLSVSDAYDNSQLASWSSSNTAVAEVDNLTGAVTPKSVGETTIRAERTIEDTHHIVDYKLIVTAIQGGTYFIRSKSSGKYVDIKNQTMANGTVIHQWDFHGGNTQRWTFTHLGDGIFTIHSANSTTKYYLGVSGDSTANNQAIVLRTGTITDGMKWKVSVTATGGYKLTPLTGEANNRVLALEGNANSNGNVLQQHDYVGDTNYTDEWLLHLEGDYSLMFIGNMDGDPLMPPIIEAVETDLINTAQMIGYASTSMSKSELLEQLSSSKVFSCITHGSDHSIAHSDGSLTIDDINALSDNAFDNLSFVYLGACDTGKGKNGAENLVNAFYNKGADSVVGFIHEIRIDETNFWTESFMLGIAQGKTINAALAVADEDIARNPLFSNQAYYTVSEDYRYILGSVLVAPCA